MRRSFDARKNRTHIDDGHGRVETDATQAGVALVRLVTKAGALVVEF